MDSLVTCPHCMRRITTLAYRHHHEARCRVLSNRWADEVEQLLAEMYARGEL